MKKLTTFLFLFASIFMAKAELNLPDPLASIDFSTGASNGVSFTSTNDSGAEAYTQETQMGGVTCRRIPAGKFLYLAVNKSKIPTNSRNVIITITYWGNNGNSLWFNYNSTSNNYAGADFNKINSGGWVTTVVALTDAELKGGMGGSDMRMGHNGGDNYIKEVTLTIGSLNPDGEPKPQQTNTPQFSEFKGKSFGGYQIWHEAGPNNADWVHWSYGHKPGQGFHMHNGVDVSSYPDVSEYGDELLFQTNLGNLGDGRSAKLYNSKDAAIINKQMEWLETVDFDGVAVQRFVGGIGKAITITDKSHLTNVKNACEATGRLFYICYDLNGSDATIVQRMKTDWVYEIEQIRALTSSPNYATVNGKPVVEVWGIGFDMATPQQNMEIIEFLQNRGCYVIGGTPNGWRTNGNYANAFKKLNCVSPWTIGVYGDINGANNYKNNTMIPDQTYCTQNGMDYLPVVFAGSANWLNDNLQLSQTFRKGGEFLWTQVNNAKDLGLSSVYYAMMDEFEESTNLFKGAVDYFDIPTNQYFETFSRDGIWVSSDYYLRLSAYAAKMLRNEKPRTAIIPVAYSEGPIYFRNSFESMVSTINKNGSGKGEGQQPDYSTVLPVDPCFYKAELLEDANVAFSAFPYIIKNSSYAKSGEYAVYFGGSALDKGVYSYKINETKIAVKENMKLRYHKYAVSELGTIGVDLLFSDATKLSDFSVYDNVTGTDGDYELTFGVNGIVGKTITGIALRFEGENGFFETYFDDIIIENGEAAVGGCDNVQIAEIAAVYSNPGKIMVQLFDINATISIYNIAGQLISKQKSANNFVSKNVNKGIYIVKIESAGNIQLVKVIVR